MGVAFFVVLERKIDGLDTMMDGKALARHIEFLDALANELRVRPLSEFVSVNPDEMHDFLEDEGMDTADVEIPPVKYFSANEGLATVRAILTSPRLLEHAAVNDLKECERILCAAGRCDVRWHFEIDI